MRRLFRALVCGMVLAVLLGPPASRAQQAVWDPEEIAQLAERSAELAEGLSRLVELVDSVDQVSRTVGRFGTLAKLDFARFDALEGLQGLGPELGPLAQNVAGLGNAKIASFQDALTVVKRLTTLPAGGGASAAAQLQQRLQAQYRKAVEDGYGLAMHTRNQMPAAPGRAALLQSQASSSTTLRGDVAAHTAASLAVLEELVGLEAILASVLEIRATQALQQAAPRVAAGQ